MMMNSSIKGLGIDIVEIDRIQEAIDSQGQKFLDRIFTPKEQEYCNLLKKGPAIRYAARFSAKEALAKALGCGFGKDLSFLDIEIRNNNLGKPEIILSDSANKRFSTPRLHLSISHSKSMATAVVIWEIN